MKNHIMLAKRFFLGLFLLLGVASSMQAQKSVYQITVYEVESEAQMNRMDQFLEKAYLPTLHAAGIAHIGVFKPMPKEGEKVDKIYVFTPFKNWKQYHKISKKLAKDDAFLPAGADYVNAKHDNAPYQRMEQILLETFPFMPKYGVPSLSGPKTERVYELRSYEGPTEKIFRNKVHMFNEGGEIDIFTRLEFNAVFYGSVVAGSKMPNLMYMTSFDNQKDRDAHWDAFRADPAWEKLKVKPEYQNNVSHIDIIMLHPAVYSDL